VVRADKLRRVAGALLAELRAAVRAPILDDVDRAGPIPHHDDRPIADGRAPKVAGIRNFRGEAYIRPDGTAEDTLLLAPINLVAGVDPVWNARDALRGQRNSGGRDRFG
jgi:hypothetical protein